MINYRKLTSGWRWEILSETGECLQHGWSKLKSRAKIQAEESLIKLRLTA